MRPQDWLEERWGFEPASSAPRGPHIVEAGGWRDGGSQLSQRQWWNQNFPCRLHSWFCNEPCDYLVPVEGVSASSNVPTVAPWKPPVGCCSLLWGEPAECLGGGGCGCEGKDKQRGKVWGPGLNLCLLLFHVFNAFPLASECLSQPNKCQLYPQLCQPLPLVRGCDVAADGPGRG